MDMDACDKRIGCVLLQKQNDEADKPMGYYSDSLNRTECAYDMSDCRCLLVVGAVLPHVPYLEECWISVRTDHDVLKGF